MTPQDDPLLWLLRKTYGHIWHIWRTENLWIANAHDYNADHATTIVHPDTQLETFVRELVDPPARACRPGHSMLDAMLFRERLDRIGDGVYVDPRPPIA